MLQELLKIDYINPTNIQENVTTMVTEYGIYIAEKVTSLGNGKFEIIWKKITNHLIKSNNT